MVYRAAFKEILTMRSTCTLLLVALIACGDNAKLKPDAARDIEIE